MNTNEIEEARDCSLEVLRAFSELLGNLEFMYLIAYGRDPDALPGEFDLAPFSDDEVGFPRSWTVGREMFAGIIHDVAVTCHLVGVVEDHLRNGALEFCEHARVAERTTNPAPKGRTLCLHWPSAAFVACVTRVHDAVASAFGPDDAEIDYMAGMPDCIGPRRANTATAERFTLDSDCPSGNYWNLIKGKIESQEGAEFFNRLFECFWMSFERGGLVSNSSDENEYAETLREAAAGVRIETCAAIMRATAMTPEGAKREADGGQPAKKRESRGSRRLRLQSQAVVLKTSNPEMKDWEVAKEVGVDPGTLSRWEVYQATKRRIDGLESDPLRGFISDGEVDAEG